MGQFWSVIDDEQALVQLISGLGDSSTVLILKHSNRCAFSSMAKNRLRLKADNRLSYYILDVLSQRELSNILAAKTGIRHESPQAFLFMDGALVLVSSHGEIRPSTISSELDSVIQI